MRTYILGCAVDNLTIDESLEKVEAFIQSGEAHQHVVVNADKVVKAHEDASLRGIINRCELVNADGMPVVWASYVLGKPLKQRVTGIDLFFRIIERASVKGWRVYLLGATQAVVECAAQRLAGSYPGLNVVGYRNGYWEPNEEESVAAEVRRARPDVLFVAISSPKKEEFLGKYQAYMRVPFAMGVGGTFDVVAGIVQRAPRWMQRMGLEWFFRFLQEPRRMFRRYFIEDMYFFWLLLLEAWRVHVRRRGA